jgi:hypothetical protein
MSSETKLDIFADYHQFYLLDEGTAFHTKNLWHDPQSVSDMIDAGPGEVAVGTLRNFTVPVTVRVLDSDPEHYPDQWDHITEASLEIMSGRLVVMGCTDYEPDAKRIAVKPGHYRVRVFYADLKSVAPNGLDGDDYIEVVLWRDEPVEPRVLKRSDAAPRGF